MVQTTSTVDATVAAETATENLIKLQRDNERSLSAWFWNSGAALFSTLVIVIGALFGFWRWRVDRRDAQDKELEDRRDEREKRVEERFQSVVEGLGSTSIATQVGAAIMLRTFLGPGYERFYSQAFDLAVAYLRLRDTRSEKPVPPDSLNQALIRVFRESFPLARDLPEQSAQPLDAIGIILDRAYLARSDLKNARMPESYLRKANLSAANLSGANLRGANFSGANFTRNKSQWSKLAGC
jgi:Pentapeptide repeats (8 copies)